MKVSKIFIFFLFFWSCLIHAQRPPSKVAYLLKVDVYPYGGRLGCFPEDLGMCKQEDFLDIAKAHCKEKNMQLAPYQESQFKNCQIAYEHRGQINLGDEKVKELPKDCQAFIDYKCTNKPQSKSN